MEIIAVHCSWADAQLTEDPILLLHLPPELRTSILTSTGREYLKALAIAARLPRCTDRFFILYNPLFVDLANRWTAEPFHRSLSDDVITLSSLAGVLPFASHLKPQVRTLLDSTRIKDVLSSALPASISELSRETLTVLLLALFRLLSYDRDYFDSLLHPIFFSSFLNLEALQVRYLAVECLSLVMHFADAFCQSLLETHVGKQPVVGPWEGGEVDYRLLKLYEEQRWKYLEQDVEKIRQSVNNDDDFPAKRIISSDLHPCTALVGDRLLPKEKEPTSQQSSFVLTQNAQSSLNQLGSALLEQKPILLAGPPSSGKTSLILEAARLLHKSESIITLHLNEQTDAKSLIGLHTTSPTDHTFVWQPGVLTQALQQGNWVLIEDIDRAPADVLGVLRPLIENGDLFIPSRKERVRAADGFRILATVRASASESSRGLIRTSWLANPRLWSVLHTETYSTTETSYLLEHRYPRLTALLETMLDVHKELIALYAIDSSFKAAQTRSPSLRDLLKWCRRTDRRIEVQNLRLASQAVPTSFRIDIFKDGIDCYASHLTENFLYRKVAVSLAQKLEISPQEMQHLFSGSTDPVQVTGQNVSIGRTTIPKVPSQPPKWRKATFADTTTSRRCLESIAAGVGFAEPYLLVGETGVGKTSLVQHIAGLVGQKLTVINLSQQSEATDLLGGLKPVTTRSLLVPLVEEFDGLFDDTFAASKNQKFQTAVSKALITQSWPRLLKLWREAIGLADSTLQRSMALTPDSGVTHASKRRKLATRKHESLRQRWQQFANNVNRIQPQVEAGDKSHSFAFVEGRLIQAVRNGEWVLLDEINLASSDTLDHIVSLLQDNDTQRPSIMLADAGSVDKIQAHPNFRVFAAMNPATDTGKKDLAPGIRSRFTELYIHPGDSDLEDLVKIIRSYLGALLENDKRAAPALGKAYLEIQKSNGEHQLTDGAGDLPHFSLRSLVRCLLYTAQHSVSHGLRRAMHEGFAMSFFTALSQESEALVLPSITKHLLGDVKNVQSFLAQQPKTAPDAQAFVAFRHHLISKGPFTPDFQPHYIRTPSVERNLINLARAASMGRFPILLQGPTSAGKTSMVEYLAKLSGNQFVRINNHEHTDLQEYLGSYASGTDGKLKFQDGVLVDALRKGHWLVLDELNLAPSDVLEALNRLLDDNRELLIPETQELIRPHPGFLLFATQNPAGLYGGRNRLSRAFRNRFLEIHFDDIPEAELEMILRERAQISPSFCTHIVSVYKKLSLQRQSSRLFEQRNSFATLRDLFRWASRPVDDRQQLAYHGFMLLGERVRDPAEREIVKTTIEETMRVSINEDVMYGISTIPASIQDSDTIVWTRAMRRLFVLVSSALKNREPVLLVGETGCGKTQICQVIAAAFERPLNIYNAHTNTETGDLIGSQRPIRSRAALANEVEANFTLLRVVETNGEIVDINSMIASFRQLDTSGIDAELLQKTQASIAAYQSLFEWSDGSLVRSMRDGEHFLLDEISLADDSVLERLNSVLEPARTILLAEKGSTDSVIIAHDDFQFLATMNPGGDYGKRELSAALRNRLTEIWVPPLSQDDDVLPILSAKLKSKHTHLAEPMLKFASWFRQIMQNNANASVPLRDLLAWAKFMNCAPQLGPDDAFLHGAGMLYIDSIGANPAGITTSTPEVHSLRRQCIEFLQTMVSVPVSEMYKKTPPLRFDESSVDVGIFSLSKMSHRASGQSDIVWEAATTLMNTMRLVRALQMDRPVLLEGSPGVGKTAIVTALAQILGKPFTRINLSEQTDLMDLFGADAPAVDEALGRFTWKDGPLLQAMKTGGWVLLDEMNLASQSVLEGLNSCLDHRKEAYIAELDKTFSCHPDFTLFAAQNPHSQGGGRKGLPASFVNRFTVVYADPFEEEDLLCICRTKYPQVGEARIAKVVQTVAQTNALVSRNPAFGVGGPWEVNLRDVSRWIVLCELYPHVDPMYHYTSLFEHRFRTAHQKEQLEMTMKSDMSQHAPESFYNRLTPEHFQIGVSRLQRSPTEQQSTSNLPIPVHYLPRAKSMITAISQGWPVVIAGSSGAGKTQLIRSLAAASGAKLLEVSMNAEIDTMDLLGGFEQYDEQREIEHIRVQARKICDQQIRTALAGEPGSDLATWLKLNQACRAAESNTASLLGALHQLSSYSELQTMTDELQKIMEQSSEMRSRFVWNDGVLVDAVHEGCWLVLDNANLCNASVLDRLNSLLEPDGHLIISEQHNSDGGVRMIKPHADFRIILTMDPRYGELSRAMRNRSLEVFLEAGDVQQQPSRAPRYPWTASINRCKDVFGAEKGEHEVVPFFDNLSLDDVEIVKSQPSAGRPSALEAYFAANQPIWRQFQSSMSQHLAPGSSSNLKYQPQKLILNEPLLTTSNIENPQVVAHDFYRLWQIAQDLCKIQSQLENVSWSAKSSAPNARTALEWSFWESAATRHGGSSIPPIFEFVKVMSGQVRELLLQRLRDKSSTPVADGAWNIVLFVRDMISFGASTDVIDLAILQALLQVGQDLARQFRKRNNPLAVGFEKALSVFKMTQLSKGLGLQKMWPSWKPRTPANFTQLNAKLAFNSLITRFDELSILLPHPRSELTGIKTKLLTAAETSWQEEGTEDVLQTMSESMHILEVQAVHHTAIPIHFQELFDFVARRARLFDLPNKASVSQSWAMLAPRDCCVDGLVSSPNSVQQALHKLVIARCDIRQDNADVRTIVSRTKQVSDRPMRSLQRIEEEIREVSNIMSSIPSILTKGTLPVLREQISTLLSGILGSHQDFLSEAAKACVLPSSPQHDLSQLAQLGMANAFSDVEVGSKYFRLIYCEHLQPAIEMLEYFTDESVGKALVHIAIAALTLMVPDRAYDPAIYERVVQQRFNSRKTELESKIGAQRAFNQRLTGQDSSLGLRLIEQDLVELGDEPSASAVVRPDVSGLTKIQEEFHNVLRAVIDVPLTTLLQANSEHEQIVRESRRINDTVDRVVVRLQKLDRAYDDLVLPVCQLLQCLGLGASLVASVVDRNEEVAANPSSNIIHVPLAGAQPKHVLSWPVQDLDSQSGELVSWLKHRCLLRGSAGSDDSCDISYLQILDFFYGQWKVHLTKDQAEAEAKSRYYAYRGDDDGDYEQEQEEVAEMFPTHDSEGTSTVQAKEKYDGRGTAIQVAKLHQGLLNHTDLNLRDYLSQAVQEIGSLGTEAKLEDVLPGLLLQMNIERENLDGSSPPVAINIYTDSVTTEIRKVYKLVQAIQSRFYEISERWPEHAVPTEVIAFSEELLDLPLNSPLAKLLTKSEKLLGIVAQWQSVASREWSVANLTDDLTTLIVSWRRLELSSWSRLLELEKQKNDEDALAWYFIAYEAVVHNSLAIDESGGDAATYTQELVRTIEEFLKSTTLGQYEPRIRLLETLQKTLHEASQANGGLVRISASIAAVITHYKRYLPDIEKSLQVARAELEKAIVEQIKLASWKDTNITALRESARRSHQKLFKIVRKYRALLGRPIAGLRADELTIDQEGHLQELAKPQQDETIVQQALEACASGMSTWNERPARLQNPLAATSTMRHVYATHSNSLEVDHELLTLRDDLQSSAKALRKETPSSLTKDNAAEVKYLRERKRRLLADTIKSIAHMGVRRNMGTAELEKQSSLSLILSKSPNLSATADDHAGHQSNLAFHSLIDSMPQIRGALTQHSDELTEGEVRRSVGLLEGLLSLSTRQRDLLAKSVDSVQILEKSMSKLQTLTLSASQVRSREHSQSAIPTQQMLFWLPSILDVACQVLDIQNQHSDLQLQGLQDSLQQSSIELSVIRDRFASQRLLPRGLIDEAEISIQSRSQEVLTTLRSKLQEWHDREPNVRYLTGQLLRWTTYEAENHQQITNGVEYATVLKINDGTQATANSVFVALQQMAALKTQLVSDTEEPGWLVRNDKWYTEAWSSLHVDDVGEGLQNLLDQLQYLSVQDLQLAVSLMTVTAPILEQYQHICQHLLDRQLLVHLETCRLALYLTKAFGTLASEGFCSPAESSDGQEQEGKMESGTGLGDGEGAEDISKDVGDDEDMSEFAKGEKEDHEGSIEGAEDAVDMGADELDGEAGDAEQKEGDDESISEGEEGNEMDEETGSVDDLDPTAVDEKMWDDAKEEAEKEEKELKGEKGKGERSEDQTAADEGAKDEEGDGEGREPEANEEVVDEEEEVGAGKAEAEHADPHLQEEKPLDLPEEMQLNGEEDMKDDVSDDGMDELSDIGQPEEVDQVDEPDKEDEKSLGDDKEGEAEGEDDREGDAQDDEIMEDQAAEEEDITEEYGEREGDAQYGDEENAGGESGAANQRQEDIDPHQKNEGQNEADQQDDVPREQGGQASENEDHGKMGQGRMESGRGREVNLERQENEALTKLADVLDQWHQRREILNPSGDQQQNQPQQDINMAEAEFEHLDGDDEGDAQALGTAAADQVQNLDQSRAIQGENMPIEEDTAMPDPQEQSQEDKVTDTLNRLQAHAGERREHGAFVPDSNDQQQTRSKDDQIKDTESMVDETASDMDNLELGQSQPPSPPTTSSDATQLWQYCSQATHQFSLILTEQLRLILSPTTATKLRGDYRTGKRLNLKRIIPYIASGYKRDKIWMRRSVPSKRNYQIMLAVDDSKSMAESGADLLALQTMAMLCKSLSMLEVGDISVLSFGEGSDGVKIAHPFGDVWKGDESGTEVFRNFSFNQKGTDVRALMERGLASLRDARLKVQGGREETWQLFLIISDGHCGEHERVRRLVREGKSERVLCVFIILDNLNIISNANGTEDGDAERRNESILDLKEAVFEPDPTREGEMRVVTRRYLERFPFEYYLVVRDVRDLPGVLARCLRGWFGGVEGT